MGDIFPWSILVPQFGQKVSAPEKVLLRVIIGLLVKFGFLRKGASVKFLKFFEDRWIRKSHPVGSGLGAKSDFPIYDGSSWPAFTCIQAS